MSNKIGRNAPCPCGSGNKYKKCCMQRTEDQHIACEPWMDEDGMHVVGKGTPPSPEEQERMTIEYQKNIKKSHMWGLLVKEYGIDKAEEMLKEFQVQIN